MRELTKQKSSAYYLPIVPHAIGIGKDGAKVPKPGLLRTASPFVKGSTPAKMPVFVVVGVDGRFLGHSMDDSEGLWGNLAVSWVEMWGNGLLRGLFISFWRPE